MQFEMLFNERVEHRLGIGRKGPLFQKDLIKRLLFIEHPGVHRRNQRVPADKIHLQRDDAEEEIAVDV